MTDKRIPDAWLHHVADGDGEPDMALSFAEDSFPFDGVCGYRSLSRLPLYTHPPSVDALIAELDGLIVLEKLGFQTTTKITDIETILDKYRARGGA